MEKKIWFKVNPPEADTRPQKLWFRAKRFGWGWYPSTWQGWGILLMYIFSLWSLGLFTNSNAHSGSDFFMQFFPTVFILTTYLIIICYAYGEKPRWNWGFKKENGTSENK